MLTSSAGLKFGRALIPSILALAAALVMLVPISPASADVCIPGTLPDGVVIPCEDNPGGGGDDGGGDNPGGGGSGAPQTCSSQGEEIPCSSDYGSWNGRCYVRAASPQPSKDEPMWRGNDDGYILECTPYACAQAGGDLTACEGHSFYWSAEAPAAVGPSAEELARRAVAAMKLSTGEVGSTPPSATSTPGSVGTIGLPIWLWIANPAPNTTGPIEASETGIGLTVTANGTLDRVEWTLTDASGAVRGSISCDGANAAGTPYDGRESAEPSPTCGFGPDLNSTPGALTLTGTAHWSIDWQGGNQTGHIDFAAESNAAQVRIGELQMLVGQ